MPTDTELSDRPEWVPAWADLDRRRAPRATRATWKRSPAYLSHTDHHVGRLLDALAETGDLDDTLVIVCSDNGASSEGGVVGSLNDGRVWNCAPRTVEEAVGRARRDRRAALAQQLPVGLDRRGQHAVPAVEARGARRRRRRSAHRRRGRDGIAARRRDPRSVRARDRRRADDPRARRASRRPQPVDGVSFAPTFTDAGAPDAHTVQYYEMLGCRALYQDGWKAVVYHPIQATAPGLDARAVGAVPRRRRPSETHDLAADEPERLRAMIERWWAEAERNQVLPLDNRAFADFVFDQPPPVPERDTYVYWPGDRHGVGGSRGERAQSRPHDHRGRSTGAGEGVLLSQGSLLGGWSFFVHDGRAVVRAQPRRLPRSTASTRRSTLGPGPHTARVPLHEDDGEHRGTGALARRRRGRRARARSRRTRRCGSRSPASACGAAAAATSPVCDDYSGPFPWTGTLARVVVRVSGAPHVDAEAEAEIAMRRQ